MNLAKAIGVGALGLLAISGWTFLSNLRNKRPPPTKEDTLEVLEAVRQQFYPVLIKIASKVTKELAPRGLTPAQNEAIVMGDPSIKQQIQKINDKIYERFSEDQIKEAVEKEFKDDNDIQHHRKEFEEQYKKSLMGVMPQRQIIISRRLRKDKVLKAIKDILEDKIDRLKTQIGGKFDQKQVGEFLESDVEEDQRITKQLIKKELGLCAKDSIKIFHFTVMQYKKDPHFNEQYEAITNNYSKRIKELLPA